MKTLISFGYPDDYIQNCLWKNECNYCTSTYYLLQADQNYEIKE